MIKGLGYPRESISFLRTRTNPAAQGLVDFFMTSDLFILSICLIGTLDMTVLCLVHALQCPSFQSRYQF